DRVLAVGVANQIYKLYESTDGGATFGRTLYSADKGESIDGVEISRSNPDIVYIAVTTADTMPKLLRSSDRGEHWTANSLVGDLGKGILRIVSIDPTN